MKFKQLGDLDRSRWARGVRRRKPLLHELLVIRVVLSILMIPSGAVAAPPAVSATVKPRLTIDTARAIETELAAVFRTQESNGAYALPDAMRGFANYPMLASASLDAYRATGNTAGVSQAAYSIARYYAYLMGAADRDGDRLIETTTPWGARGAAIEEPGFNSLLALDMRNLARLNFELRRTLPALHWYDTARILERAVIAVTFDADANYFFPHDPASGRPVRSLNPIAALPASFPDAMGDNYGEKVAYHVVRWAGESFAPSAAPDDIDARAVERLAALDVLRPRGHNELVSALGSAGATATGGAVARYASERAAMPVPLVDGTLPLELLLLVARHSQQFADVEVMRIERSVPVVSALAVSDGPTAGITPETADLAIQSVYTAASALREKLRARTFFNDEDRRTYPSGDPTVATQRLIDDALAVARRAETRLFQMRTASAGLRVSAQLASDAVVSGETVTMRWEIASQRPVSWKKISAGVFGETLVEVNASPLRVTPSSPLRFTTRHALRTGAGVLKTATFTMVLEDSLKVRQRYHAVRSAFVHPPVGVVARFPAGRTINSESVTIALDFRRHSAGSYSAQYFWFSPAGLKLREGASGTISFGAGDSTVVQLHVEIPNPCRPGLFPFTLKFYSNDRDAGTISSSLFKPYQWTYVGAFPASGGMERAHPPEKGVNLLQNYGGASGKVQWRIVPDNASGSHGEIALRGLANQSGVHYLYTVVACAYETDIRASLVSNCPAAVFVNGRKSAVTKGAAGDSTTANVHLDADKNHILIKLLGDAGSKVWFSLGDDGNLAADEYDNNLLELAGGYRELTARELGTGTSTRESRRLVTLQYQDAGAQNVAVVGSFNGWSPDAHPMKKTGDGWELTLSLPPGRYAYRFLVDKNKQVLDPSSRTEEPDGYGGMNSVMVVER